MQVFKRLNKGHFAFFANVAWLIGDRILRIPLALTISVLVARYLQPEQFGKYSVALAVYAILSAFNNLGLQSVMVRMLVGGIGKNKDLIYTGFLLQLGASIASVGMAAIAAAFIAGVSATNFWVIVVVSFGLLPKSSDICRYFFESTAQFKYSVIADNVSYILGSLLRLVLIYSEAPLIAFAWAFVVEITIAGLLLYLFERKFRDERVVPMFRTDIARDLLNKSWPLLISNLAIALYMRVDQLLLNHFKGSEAVGVFAAAMRLVEAWYVFPSVLVLALNPVLIRSLLHDTQMHRRRFRTMVASLVLGTAIVSLVVTACSHLIEQFLYGSAFPGSGHIISITIWASVFVVIGICSSQWLVNHHMPGYVGIRTVTGLVVTIISNFLLIPRYGAVGAAVSLVIAQAAAALSLLAFPKVRGSFGF